MRILQEYVRNAWTTQPRTKDFRHMLPVPKYWLPKPHMKKYRNVDASPDDPVVKENNRIRFWDIVPGDRVRVRGGGEQFKDLMEVAQVNKLSNEVRLRKARDERDKDEDDEYDPRKRRRERAELDTLPKVHYSRLQLYWKHVELEGKPDPVPVFITRMRTTRPKWVEKGSYYHWQRFAAATAPRLPKEMYTKISIPWPTSELEKIKEAAKTWTATNYETAEDVMRKVTYEPPTAEQLRLVANPSVMRAYVRSLYNPTLALQVRGPMEPHLTRELSNPYSRAKRQQRWKARKEYGKLLLSQIMTAELKNLNGRTRREARAEAAFKWKAQLGREAKEEVRTRAVKRGDIARTDKKRAKKLKKEKKKIDMLRRVVLREGPNQILPAGSPQ